jgi:ribosomal protein L37E
MSDNQNSDRYQCARCGDSFDSYDEAKYHVVTSGFPVNPGSHIIGPADTDTDQ